MVISMDAETGYPKASRVYKQIAGRKGRNDGGRHLRRGGWRTHLERGYAYRSEQSDGGEIGTQVNVTVQRGGQELEFTITRAQIQAEYVEYRMLDNEVGYILISEFSTKCDEEFEAAAAQLQSQGMKRLVLDVRSNPGGYVDQAVNIADYCCRKGLSSPSETKTAKRRTTNPGCRSTGHSHGGAGQ